MSNEHPGHSDTKVTRNVKDKDGKTEKKEVPIPSIIFSYNCFMSGIDRSDQLINNYNVLRQTKKYWKTLFLHFIDIAVVNSYILYKELHPDPKSRMSHYIFRETLVRQLCNIEISFHQSVGGRKSDPTIEHVSERLSNGRDCVYCKAFYGVRRRTTRQCVKCKAPLCLLARNCFLEREGTNGCSVYLCLHNHLNPEEDLKEVQPPRVEASESARIGELNIIRLLLV